MQALKGGLGGRKPKLDRQRRAKPAAQARQQGGMVRVGSAMKKSRSGFLVPSLSNPDLLAEGAAAQGTFGPDRLWCVCVCVALTEWLLACLPVGRCRSIPLAAPINPI